jgi:Gpi18-like mannosyltransferase
MLVKIREDVMKSPLKTIMTAAVISRAFVFAVGILTASIFGERLLCQYCWDISIPFINLFSRWDSNYYVDIALYGYRNLIGPQWAFFPGYPALMALLGHLLAILTPIPLDFAMYSAGFTVSNLAFFGSIYYLYKLTMLVTNNAKVATYSTLLLAFYPAGVFLSATYSDSLFLLLTLSSLYYWRMGDFKSAVLGFFSALTRPVGVFLIVPYLHELLTTRSRPKTAITYLSVASILVGFLSFLAFSELMTGTPFAIFETEHLYWGVTLNLQSVLTSAYNDLIGNPIIIPYLALAIGGLVTSILSARSKETAAIDAYALSLLATYMFATLISFPRYSITLIPAYWGYATWSQREGAGSLVFAVFLVLLAISVGLFVNWYSFY